MAGGPALPPMPRHRHRRSNPAAAQIPCRVDFSSVHAYEARQAFLACIAEGEAAVDLAAAALHVAAEDDALGASQGRRCARRAA